MDEKDAIAVRPLPGLAPGTVLLDTARPDAENRQSLCFRDPLAVLTAEQPAEVEPLLAALDAAVAQGRYVAGFLGYEAGYAFEPALRPSAPVRPPGALPLAWFGVYTAPERVADGAVAHDPEATSYAVRNLHFDLDRDVYDARLAAIKRHIQEGDVYQINFTGRLTFDFEGAPLALYRELRRRQRVAYGGVIDTGAGLVLSCSPELFFRRDGDRIWTRPMKGTVRRGRTQAEDEALRAWLAQDEKSRAENLMIVDLLRNDLSICCRPGSVRVPALFTTERYETLIQMTSTVEGRLRPGVRYADLFRALFPCGSVTGAPKIRAMQLIRALEATPRGVYCGAVGYAGPADEAVFNVAIRTVVLRDGRGEMGTGSGIVWDSDAAAEYDECRLKARFLADPPAVHAPFALIETMRWADGEIPLLPLHLDRLRASAAYFGYPLDEARLRGRLAAACRALAAGTAHKVRLTLDEAGRLDVTTAPLEAPPEGAGRVAFSPHPVDSEDIFFYHKTTRRPFYEAAYQQARAAGLDEVLFLNERGEVTEGTRSNVVIRRGDRRLTPPLSSGLLGGVYRRHLLDTGADVFEQVLYPEDVRQADAVYICNAVRGLRRVSLI